MSLLNQLFELSSQEYPTSSLFSFMDEGTQATHGQGTISGLPFESKQLPSSSKATHPSQNVTQKVRSRSIYEISLDFGDTNSKLFEKEKDKYKKMTKMNSILQNKIRKYYYQFTMALQFCMKHQKEQQQKQIEKICDIIHSTTAVINNKILNAYLQTTNLSREFRLIYQFSNQIHSTKRIFSFISNKYIGLIHSNFQHLKRHDKFTIKIDIICQILMKIRANCEKRLKDQIFNILSKCPKRQTINLQVAFPHPFVCHSQSVYISNRIFDRQFRSERQKTENISSKLPASYSHSLEVQIPDIHDSMHIFFTLNESFNNSRAHLPLAKRSSSLSWTGSDILPISVDKLNDISEIQILEANLVHIKEPLCKEPVVKELDNSDFSRFSLCINDDFCQISQAHPKKGESYDKFFHDTKKLPFQKNCFQDFPKMDHFFKDQTFKNQKKKSLCISSSSSFSKKEAKSGDDSNKSKFQKPRLSINDLYQMKQGGIQSNPYAETQKIDMRERKSLTILELEKDKRIIEGLIEDLKRSNGKNAKKTPIKEGSTSQQKLIDTIQKISKLQVGSSSKKMNSKAKDSGKSNKYERPNLARNRQSVEIRDFSELISLGDSYLPLFQNQFNKVISTPATRREPKVESSNLKNYFDYQTQKKGVKVPSNSKTIESMSKSANQQKKFISLKMKKNLKQTATPFSGSIQPKQQSAPFNYVASIRNKQNGDNFWSKQRQKNRNYAQNQQKQARYSIDFRQKR